MSRRDPRRFHAYCVGTAKSGTHSIAGLFLVNYLARHEPDYDELWSLVYARRHSLLDDGRLDGLAAARDRRLMLEMDSSNANYYVLDSLLRLFPRARFILTIRDCYSWLDSWLNHRLSRPRPDNWRMMHEILFGGPSFRYSKQDRFLKEFELPPISAYLSSWAEHNRKVLAIVPKERLLVVRTHEIASDLDRITDFLGLQRDTLDYRWSHAYKAERKFHLLRRVDTDWLEDLVRRKAGDLMREYFPEYDAAGARAL